VSQEVELEGDLGEMPVNALLHWMGWGRKSGLLELHGPAEERVDLRFVRGRLSEYRRSSGGVSRIEVEPAPDPEELGRLLREPLLWNEGRFVLYPADAAAEEEPAAQALADSAPTIEELVADSLLKGQYQLPALSDAAVRIGRMRGDPRASQKQLVDIIATSPALTQAVLRYANSAAGGTTHPIDSLPMAVARVGIRTIQPLALAGCLYSAELRSAPLRSVQTQLWRHSLSVALLSRHLAVKLKLDDAEAFLCGLLHDMGKAVLLRLVDDLIQRGKTSPLELGALEELLQKQHGKVGRKLPLRWNLPSSVDQVALFHHSPEAAAECQSLVAIVALANATINILEKDGALPDSHELSQSPAARMLGLSLRQVESFSAAAMEAFEQGQDFVGS
jgi:putative nucleotidyltransferase with HDIG domain